MSETNHFTKILNNVYIFDRIKYYIHENHYLYSCKSMNYKIDDALWLAKGNNFDIIRRRIEPIEINKYIREYSLGYWPAEALSILIKMKQYDILQSLVLKRDASQHRYLFFTTAVVDTAIKSESPLDILELIEKYYPRAFTWKAYETASEFNRLDVIKWLRSMRPTLLPPATATIRAAKAGNIEIIRYYHDASVNENWINFSKKTLDSAVISGNLNMVNFILECRTEGLSHETIDLMAEKKEMHHLIFKLVQETHWNAQCTNKAAIEAVRHSNTRLLKLLLDNDENLTKNSQISIIQRDLNNLNSFKESAMSMAMKRSDLECFKLLKSYIEKKSKALLSKLICSDLFSEKMDIERELAFLEYMKSQKYEIRNEVLNNVISNGDFHLYKHLVSEMFTPLSDHVMDLITQASMGSGHLEMTIHVYNQFMPKKSIEDALVQGIFTSKTKPYNSILEILGKLHNQENFPLRLKNFRIEALSNLSPLFLEFYYKLYGEQNYDNKVHEDSSIESKINFLQAASKYGNLEIAQKTFKKRSWLKESYKEAMQNNHLNIITYMTETLNYRGGEDEMMRALTYGNARIADYIYRHTKDNESISLKKFAANCSGCAAHHLLATIGNERNTLSNTEYTDFNVGFIPNLTFVKLVTSQWYQESLKLKVKFRYSGTIDVFVYLVEELKYDFDEMSIEGNISTLVAALSSSNYEIVDYIFDRLILKHKNRTPPLPNALYRRLESIGRDETNERDHNYRLFQHFLNRLENELQHLQG